MKRLLIAGTLFLSAASTRAADFAVVVTPPGAMNILVLVAAVVGAVGAFQVSQLVRGGLMSKSWQLFAAAFGVLFLGQLLALLEDLQVFAMPTVLIPVLWLIAFGLFCWAVYQTKRTLS